MSYIRLDKYLSQALCESRSDAKRHIKEGRVSIDGVICLKAEQKLEPENAVVEFDGRRINYSRFVYIVMNKPKGVICASSDKNDKTVVQLLSQSDRAKGIFPVGRLDKDTCGLIILTNDGEFAHNSLSPKKHVNKTYYAEVEGEINKDCLEKFRQGIIIVDKDGKEIKLKSADLKILSSEGGISKAIVTISEGKFHQIKKMFLSVGGKVVFLKRIKFGDIELDNSLKEGEYRPFNEKEMEFVIKILKRRKDLK